MACAAWLATNITHPHDTRLAQSLSRGSVHRGLRRVFALVTFGYELELLTLQMRVLQREVSRFLVAEATSTYHAVNRGMLAPSKPAVLSEALGNGTFPLDLAAMTTVVVLRAAEERSRCTSRFAGPHGCWEARHRAALLDQLLAIADHDDDMALLADVDELASPSVVRLLRRCAPLWHASRAPDAPHKYTLQAWSVFYGVHCWPRVATWKAPHAYSVAWLRKRLRDDRPPMSAIQFLDTRADVSRPPMVRDAGWHFTSTGASALPVHIPAGRFARATDSACHAQSHSSLGHAPPCRHTPRRRILSSLACSRRPHELRRKLTTWGHANMFSESNHPGSLDLARLERCQRFCLEANAGRGQRDAPPCASRGGGGGGVGGGGGGAQGGGRDRKLPGVLLTEATLGRATLPEYLLRHRAQYPSLFQYLS